MTSPTLRVGASCVVALGLVVLAAWAGHEHGAKLAWDHVPEAARLALQAQAGDAEITAVERERKHGAVVYEAEWAVDGTIHEVAVTEEGALLETAMIISVADAPEAVRATINSWFGDTAVEVERTTIVVYEVESEDGRELMILPTGGAHPGGDHDDDDGDED